jgi:hypothetical protein
MMASDLDLGFRGFFGAGAFPLSSGLLARLRTVGFLTAGALSALTDDCFGTASALKEYSEMLILGLREVAVT